MELLLNTRKIAVEFYPEENYFYFNWKGFHNKASIIETGKEVLEIFKTRKCPNILNDNSKVKGPWNEAAEWTTTEWFPAMEKSGMKNFAWIFSQDIFAELSAKQAMPASESVKSFNNLDSAKEWLKERNGATVSKMY